MSRAVLNSTANSGPSVGASSLVTDANSALSGGPHLQRSSSINGDSYLRLPASPMSFSSNNISISGSSILDGSSIMQPTQQDQSSQQGQKRQQGASTASSQPSSRVGQVSLPTGNLVSNSSNQEAYYLSQMQKRPRLDFNQEDGFQQQVMHQLLQRQDSMQLQGQNPQINALIQQQRLLQRQQQPQQMLQSMPQMQRAQLQQQLQQQQLQQQQLRQVQQQNLQSVSAVKRPYENGVCARRLMQYIYHQRHRPDDNSITYWKKFVAEYFAPRAKKRWCLSSYENVGQHALGVFPQATMDAWQCDICGSKSGRGFEAAFEVLPRLNKVKFDSGVLDEILYLDMPRECRFPSGILMLEYGKAIQESVFEQLRVIREGHLRIIFSPDLKILSWEFCARRHEELLPRRLVAPQVNQLLQVAQKYQNAVTESGSAGVSTQDLQANWNMFLTAGRQLARNMELPLLNDLGFSKRYVRCLQISEVVNSMKDLIDFSRERHMGPIESLKNYPRQVSTAKFQMQKMQDAGQQQIGAQGLSTDRSTLNKIMSMHPGLNNQMNNNNHMIGSGILNTPGQNAVSLSSYQNLLRQSSMNANGLKQEAVSFNSPSPYLGAGSSIQGPMQNVSVSGLSNVHLPQHQQHSHHPLNGSFSLQQNNPQSSPSNQNTQQHMIQQLLHEMMNSNGAGKAPQQSSSGQNANGPVGEESFNSLNGPMDGSLPVKTGNTSTAGSRVGIANNGLTNFSGAILNGMQNRSNSFKMMSTNSNSVGGGGGNGNDSFSLKSCSDVTQDLQLPELEADITNEFPEWDM